MTAPETDRQARLTALALGELDEATARRVEAEIAGDPAARNEVERIRQTAHLLGDALRSDPDPAPNPQLRRAVEQELQRRRGLQSLWILLFLRRHAQAAVLLLTLSLILVVSSMTIAHRIAPDVAVGKGIFKATLFPRRLAGPRPLIDPVGATATAPFLAAREHPSCVVPIEVTDASFALLRHQLRRRRLPAPAAVQVEQLVNHFRYDDPAPRDGRAVNASVEVASCPWQSGHRLVRIGVRGRPAPETTRPPARIVFVIDARSSASPDRLPLMVRAMRALQNDLDQDDRIAIITAGEESTLLLPSSAPTDPAAVMAVGSLGRIARNGPASTKTGIRDAYVAARDQRADDGANRIVLVTDGDVERAGSLRRWLRVVEANRDQDIALSVLGFGIGSLSSGLGELADRGGGRYFFVDSVAESQRAMSRLLTPSAPIAEEVHLRVRFHRRTVSAYRWIGYDRRPSSERPFGADAVLSASMPPDHRFTALFEVVPQTSARVGDAMLTVEVAYRDTATGQHERVKQTVVDGGGAFESSSSDLRFAAALAMFGRTLIGVDPEGLTGYDRALAIAGSAAAGADETARRQLLDMIRVARRLQEPGTVGR